MAMATNREGEWAKELGILQFTGLTDKTGEGSIISQLPEL